MAFDPITAGINVLSTVLDRILPNKAEADRAKAELLTMQVKGDLDQMLGQLEINKAEAQHASIFVAGWRPASGWICNIGLLYTFLLQPLLTWMSTVAVIPVPPQIPFDALYVLLGSLLGVGTLRTVDKKFGTDTK